MIGRVTCIHRGFRVTEHRVDETIWRDDVLAGQRIGQVEINRIDDMDLGAALDRLANARVEQWQFAARIAANQDDGTRVIDVGNRHRKRSCTRAVSEIELAQTAVDVFAT